MIIDNLSKEDITKKYLTNLITDGKTLNSRRSLTIETINRYIFVLNTIY
jgi:hypothetical protein